MATHSSTLAWKLPWIQEPSKLQSVQSQRVGHDWVTSPYFTFPTLLYCQILISIHDYWKKNSFDYMDLFWQIDVSAFNTLLRFVFAFLPRSKCLFISRLQSLSTMILEPKNIKYVTASTFSPYICHEAMGPDAMDLLFWMLSFKTAFSLSSFTHIRSLLVPLHFLPLDWYLLIWDS